MAIIALLLAAVIPAFRGFSQSESRHGAVGNLMGALDHARMMAIAEGKATYLVFAPADPALSPSYWGRAYVIYQDRDNVTFTPAQRTPWLFLPSGMAFKISADVPPPAAASTSILTCYGAGQAAASTDPAFPVTGAAGSGGVKLPYLKFDSTGGVSVPAAVPSGQEADYLRVLLFPGFVNGSGAEVPTQNGGGSGNKSAVLLEEISLNQATGRARYNVDPLNNLTPTPAP